MPYWVSSREVFCLQAFLQGLGFIKETFYLCVCSTTVCQHSCSEYGLGVLPTATVAFGSFAGWFSQVALLYCCLIWLLCATDHCLICLISAVLLLLSAYSFSLCARGEHQGGGMQLLRDHPLLVPTLLLNSRPFGGRGCRVQAAPPLSPSPTIVCSLLYLGSSSCNAP